MARRTTPATAPAAAVRVSPIAPSGRAEFTFVSVHATEQDALIAVQLVDDFSYVLKYNTGAHGSSKVYRCAEHTNCESLLRVRAQVAEYHEGTEYVIEQSGRHATERSGSKRSGIHPVFLADIDKLAVRMGPKKILATLKRTYGDQPKLLAELPTEGQIKNRKASMGKKGVDNDADDSTAGSVGKPGDLMALCDLYEWAGMRYCTDASAFFPRRGVFERATDEAAFAQLLAQRRDATAVLKAFHHSVVLAPGDAAVPCIGVILTSRRVFRNALYAVEGQHDDGVLVAVETIGMLDHGEWSLVALGTYVTRFMDPRVYRKQFVPWAYMAVCNVHDVAYDELFRTVTASAKAFFNVDLTVRFGRLNTQDTAVTNAFTAMWPEATLLDCYQRVAHTCAEQIGLLADTTYYHRQIYNQVKQLHKARSSEQFAALTSLCVQQWRDDGKDQFAEWFQRAWMNDQQPHWCVTSGLAGLAPVEKNPLESQVDIVRECGVSAARTTVTTLLNDCIPKVLERMGANAPTRATPHYGEGPLPSAMLHKAAEHLQPGAYHIDYHRVKRKRVARALLFNCSAGHVSADATRCNVTPERVNVYLDSKAGELFKGTSANDIQRYFQCLHEVEVLGTPDEIEAFKLDLTPVVDKNKIRQLRRLYRCDCSEFWMTGWLCSHVIATTAVLKQFDLASSCVDLNQAR